MEPPTSFTVRVSDARVGERRGYIYCVLAPRFRAAYLGQTRSNQGALGRLSQHLSEGAGSQFRARVAQFHRCEYIDLGAVDFLAIALAGEGNFQGASSEYREAVESLVAARLRNELARASIAYGLVSWHRRNAYCEMEVVSAEAVRVTGAVTEWIKSLSS